jgi:mannosyltransferase
MVRKANPFSDVKIILGNSNRRFSGVTSTMLQVLPHVAHEVNVVVLGRHHLPENFRSISFFQAARYLRSQHPDGSPRLFHARRNDEMIQALTLKWVFRSKIRIVFTSTAQRKKSWLTRFLMRNMDGLLSTCNAAASFMPSPPDRIIPHGINLELFNKVNHDRIGNIDFPAKYNIGLYGRVRKQKGVDLLIDAALQILPRHKDWGVVFVGEITSEEERFVENQRAKLSEAAMLERVRFTGKVPFDVLPSYFQGVDIVCALSTNEGFGLTVLEGASCSKPVIATKAGAWPDILENSSAGYLIEVGGLTELVEFIESLIESKSERQRLGRNGSLLVREKYTVERESEQLLSYYEVIRTKA